MRVKQRNAYIELKFRDAYEQIIEHIEKTKQKYFAEIA